MVGVRHIAAYRRNPVEHPWVGVLVFDTLLPGRVSNRPCRVHLSHARHRVSALLFKLLHGEFVVISCVVSADSIHRRLLQWCLVLSSPPCSPSRSLLSCSSCASTFYIVVSIADHIFSDGVLQPFSQMDWWKWMYRLSPYTYFLEGILGNGMSHIPSFEAY